MRLFQIFVVTAFASTPAFADRSFEGSWGRDNPNEGWTASVFIERYGNVFVGSTESGSYRGRLWFSKLKGWVEGDKLFTRICDEQEDGSKKYEINDCLENGAVSNYFVIRGKELVWFRKEQSVWEEYLILQPEKVPRKKSKDSSNSSNPVFQKSVGPNDSRSVTSVTQESGIKGSE